MVQRRNVFSTSFTGPGNLRESVTRYQKEILGPPPGRPRGAALAELTKLPGFSDRIAKIRADSKEYTRNGLQERVAQVKPNPIDHELLASFVRSQVEAAPNSTFMNASTIELHTASGDNPGQALESITLPAENPYQYDRVRVEGEGDGLNYGGLAFQAFTPFPFLMPLWGGSGGTRAEKSVIYKFQYTPPADGRYEFSVYLLGWGAYALAADDGWPDSKEVSCGLYGQIIAPLDAFSSGPTHATMFERGDDNILEADTFAAAYEFRSSAQCQGGVQLDLSAGLAAAVLARGDGSTAEMDFSLEKGGFACLGLTVTQV